FGISAATADGRNWLVVPPTTATAPASVSISADPSNLAPGTYRGKLIITPAAGASSPIEVQVIFSVIDPRAPALKVTAGGLAFSLLQGGAQAIRTLFVSNAGDGSLPFVTTVTTDKGSGWLAITPARGNVGAEASIPLNVTVDPKNLAIGAYTARILIVNPTAIGQTVTVQVSLIVNPVRRILLLSQTGFTFTTLEGGPAAPPEAFAVLNTGQDLMDWNASVEVGAPWLSISPASGVTDAASLSVPFVQVKVNPAGLKKGSYYGRIVVNAAKAVNL